MENVKVHIASYRLEVSHEGFVFVAYVDHSEKGSFIESIRILSDSDQWRDVKVAIKKNMIEEVEMIVKKWIRTNLLLGHLSPFSESH